MSTKIYDAYKVNDNKIETVFRIKERVEQIYQEFVQTVIKSFGNSDVDKLEEYHKIKLELLPGEESPFGKNKKFKDIAAWQLLDILDAVQKRGINELLNFQNSMCLYQYRGQLYIQFFGFDQVKVFNKYLAGLLKRKVLGDFYFQDASDDEFDNPEYMKREKIWDRIFNNEHSSPSKAGFCHDFWNRKSNIIFGFWDEYREGLNA